MIRPCDCVNPTSLVISTVHFRGCIGARHRDFVYLRQPRSIEVEQPEALDSCCPSHFDSCSGFT